MSRSTVNRRFFLGSSLGGIATALTLSSAARGADESESPRGPTSEDTRRPDTLFLTWQRDPTTTITIQWVDRETTANVDLQYATWKDPVWQIAKTITKPYPNTDLKVFRCEITGLKPGTEYQFSLGNHLDSFRFRTLPAKATETFTFVSGGDAGIGTAAVKTNILAARQAPYFALIGGDLAYDNGKSPNTFTSFLRNYSQHMVDPEGRLIPLIACIGNHEVAGGYRGRRDQAPQFLALFDGFFSESTYGVLDIGDYLSLVLLDTNHIAGVAGEQTAWLTQTLAERQSRPHLIVANHVPAYPSVRAFAGKEGNPNGSEEQRQHWCPLFERFNVDIVLEHHDHAFKRTHPLTNGLRDKRGVLYLGDGSWGKIRPVTDLEARPYLAAASSAYHVTTHRLEGEQRYHVALEESGRIADVCATSSKRAAL